MDKLWLPTGSHYSLNISHHPGSGSGSIGTGGRKLVLHTTESPRRSASSIASYLVSKGYEPHFVFGYDPGKKYPSVIQLLPLNQGGKALEHTLPQETNRANCVQIEICGYAGHSYRWSDNYLKGLANLAALIHHRFKFPVHAYKFGNPPPGGRLSGPEWVRASGIIGHEHCPGNSHWDPGAFKGRRFVELLDRALHHPDGGLKLKPSSR